ncbi:hypothetical protein WA158_007977 [Blastocystis sp. Blastoise]
MDQQINEMLFQVSLSSITRKLKEYNEKINLMKRKHSIENEHNSELINKQTKEISELNDRIMEVESELMEERQKNRIHQEKYENDQKEIQLENDKLKKENSKLQIEYQGISSEKTINTNIQIVGDSNSLSKCEDIEYKDIQISKAYEYCQNLNKLLCMSIFKNAHYKKDERDHAILMNTLQTTLEDMKKQNEILQQDNDALKQELDHNTSRIHEIELIHTKSLELILSQQTIINKYELHFNNNIIDTESKENSQFKTHNHSQEEDNNGIYEYLHKQELYYQLSPISTGSDQSCQESPPVLSLGPSISTNAYIRNELPEKLSEESIDRIYKEVITSNEGWIVQSQSECALDLKNVIHGERNIFNLHGKILPKDINSHIIPSTLASLNSLLNELENFNKEIESSFTNQEMMNQILSQEPSPVYKIVPSKLNTETQLMTPSAVSQSDLFELDPSLEKEFSTMMTDFCLSPDFKEEYYNTVLNMKNNSEKKKELEQISIDDEYYIENISDTYSSFLSYLKQKENSILLYKIKAFINRIGDIDPYNEENQVEIAKSIRTFLEEIIRLDEGMEGGCPPKYKMDLFRLIHNRLNDKLITPFLLENNEEDEIIKKRCQILSQFLTLSNVGRDNSLREEPYKEYWMCVEQHLKSMTHYTNPYDKQICLYNVSTLINLILYSKYKNDFGADLIMDILLFILLNSQVPCLLAQIQYTNTYRLKESDSDELSYFIFNIMQMGHFICLCTNTSFDNIPANIWTSYMGEREKVEQEIKRKSNSNSLKKSLNNTNDIQYVASKTVKIKPVNLRNKKESQKKGNQSTKVSSYHKPKTPMTPLCVDWRDLLIPRLDGSYDTLLESLNEWKQKRMRFLNADYEQLSEQQKQQLFIEYQYICLTVQGFISYFNQ